MYNFSVVIQPFRIYLKDGFFNIMRSYFKNKNENIYLNVKHFPNLAHLINPGKQSSEIIKLVRYIKLMLSNQIKCAIRKFKHSQN